MVRKLQLLLAYVRIQFFVILASEREFTAQKSKKENSKGPNVRRRPRIFNFAHNFWSHIRRSSTENLDFSFVRNTRRETKIDQFYSLFGLVQQNVLQFDVSMSDVALMTIVDCLDNLSPQKFGLKFWHLSIWFHFEVTVE